MRSLSNADIRVLALTHMIEVETNGSEHLRVEPMKAGTAIASTVSAGGVRVASVATTGMPSSTTERTKKAATKAKMKKVSSLNVSEGRTIIVRGLKDKSWNETTLKLRFAPFGDVQSVVLMRNAKNGKSRGFGYVTYESETSANRALEMDGEVMFKRELKVAMWTPPPAPKEEQTKSLDTSSSSSSRQSAPATVSTTKSNKSKTTTSEKTTSNASSIRRRGQPDEVVVTTTRKTTNEESAPRKVPFSYAAALSRPRVSDVDARNRQTPVSASPRRAPTTSTKAKKKVYFTANALLGKSDGPHEESDASSKQENDATSSKNTKSRILGLTSSLVQTTTISKEEEAEDAVGWITPTNIVGSSSSNASDANMSGNGQSTVRPASKQSVGCITLDFAMQNVLTQIGLNVVAADGRVIQRVKQFVLRCDGCFRIERDTSKLFCGHCGHNTLKKVAVTLNKDGTTKFHLNPRRINAPQRGVRYSIPKRKGGRNHNDILLAGDELLMGEWRLRAGRKNKLQSMFGPGITESLGLRVAEGTNVVVGYGRKNPNARRGRERRGAKKRNKNRQPKGRR